MKIKVNLKKPSQMRLPCYRFWGAGDYYWKGKTLVFDICAKNFDEARRILIHEEIEQYIIEKQKISIKEIDKFDSQFKGDDPGADKKAPYHQQHVFATLVENHLEKF